MCLFEDERTSRATRVLGRIGVERISGLGWPILVVEDLF
jgi:hypothetical protein